MPLILMFISCAFITTQDLQNHRDFDGDGFIGTQFGGDDCDDDDPAANPGETETWDDGTDQDCDGRDTDQDGDGQSAIAAGGADCNDADASAYAGATEVWYDGADQACDEGSDYDQDGDGYDADSHDGTDCDDIDPLVNPSAVEVWYDDTDQDCDGASDYDADGDGYDSSAYDGTDCDDTDPAFHPLAAESCAAPRDYDCDGTVDFSECGYTTSTGARMMGISPGTFVMSSGQGDPDDDYPDHDVTLTHAFWLGEAEVTRDQWEAAPGNSRWNYGASCSGNCPADYISWYDAARYANWLSSGEGLEPCYSSDGTALAAAFDDAFYDCTGYRMPTEAEWEYAARGGVDSAWSGGEPSSDVAWTVENSGLRSHPVCTTTYPANFFGLCDMSGNVMEWTNDWYEELGASPVTDPTGPSAGYYRMLRGGDWSYPASYAKVSFRGYYSQPETEPASYQYTFGLRLARTAP